MRKIRFNTFETNSSSTHAIVIPKKVKEERWSLYAYRWEQDYGFGREECRLVEYWNEKLAYIYLVLRDTLEEKDTITLNNFKLRVERLFIEVHSSFQFDYSNCLNPKDVFEYIDKENNYGNFVDHSAEIPKELIERVLEDDDFLKRFLFNTDSYITIGGDEYRGYNIKGIGFEDDYDYKEHYYVDKYGKKPPEEWFDENGRIKDEYYKEYFENYNVDAGGFWGKLNEYKKENDVYLKGN